MKNELEPVAIGEITDNSGVDAALGNLKKLKRSLEAIELNKKKELDKIESKFGFDSIAKQLNESIKQIESELMKFVGNNLETVMGDCKTAKFANGVITARSSSEVYFEDEAKSIELLKDVFPDRADFCVKIAESLSKSTLKNWNAEDLAQIEVLIQENINLGYEIN